MKYIYSFSASIFFGVVLPLSVRAQDFVPLSRDPGFLGLDSGVDMSVFLNRMFAISIAVAAVLAVIMIAIGGFKYMTSESVFNIGNAKEQIMNAIVGLIIVLSAILLLSVINPEIVTMGIFQTR